MNPLRRRLPLLGGAVLLLLVSCSGSSPHSLRYISTLVSDPDQEEPLYFHVGYVDEQPIVSYHVATQRMLPQVPWMEKVGKDNPHYWEGVSQIVKNWRKIFSVDLVTLQNRFNQSSSPGLHTLQVMYGCEVGADRQVTATHEQYAYDGEDFLSFDAGTLTWTAPLPQALETKRRWESDERTARRQKAYLEEDCVEWLRRYLDYGNETLQRRVPPTVKVVQKVYQDGQETLICRAHGFYPKEIEISWMKDGVQQQDTLTGGVIPNSDGTYHKWLSVDVDPKDRDRYRCQVAHDGLQEPLDLAWEEPVNVGLVVGILAGVLLAAALVGGVIYYIRMNNRARNGFKAAPPE